MNKILLLLVAIFLTYQGHCQKKAVFGKDPSGNNKGRMASTYKTPKLDNSSSDWTKTRFEYTVGAGVCAFMGDLGGQDGPSKPFLYDFEPTQMRYSLSGGARYYLREYHAFKGTFSYARVRGSDATTNYPNRHYRNLNFKSPILELSGHYELYLLKPKILHLAGARSTQIFNGNRLGAYVSAGAGVFYFNPKAELNGEWYALKPLGTEGQGLPNGPKPYKRLNITFPLGGGVTYLLNWNYTIGVDVSYRWTTTDYIDDASGYYYDNDIIAQNNGKLAAILANPSVLLDDVPNPDWYTKNQPRGGSNSNDTYLFAQVTLSHSFAPSISNKPYKQGKRKKGKSYNQRKKNKRENGKKGKSYKTKGIKEKKKRFKAPKLDFGKKRKKSKIRTF